MSRPVTKKGKGRRDCKVVELQVLKWQMYLQCRGGLSMPFSLSRVAPLYYAERATCQPTDTLPALFPPHPLLATCYFQMHFGLR